MQVKLSDLFYDKKLYPRVEVNWVTVASYTDAMRAGDKFPPIEVVKSTDGKWLVVDGWHRGHAAKAAKLDTIEAVLVKAETEQERFLRAVETNLRHGRNLSPFEKAQIAARLCSTEFKWSQSKIAGFLHMTKESLRRMITKRSVTSNGFGLGKVHKAPLEHLVQHGEEVSPEAEAAEATLAVRDQLHLFGQALAVAEGGIVDFSDPKLCEVLERLAGWFRENRPRIREGMKEAA